MASIQIRQSTLRQRQNQYIHSCFIRNDYRECLKAIEAQLHACSGQSEYPLYIKGLIMRQQGRIEESLTIFQAALCLNPVNMNNIKQVGQSLFLLGKHREALSVFEELDKIRVGDSTGAEDRTVWHSKGMCYMFLRQIELAISCFETANKIQQRERTFIELGNLYKNEGQLDEALNVILDGLDAFPQSPELLTSAGLLQLQLNNPTEGFLHLGNALTYDPRNPTAILGAGSIIQSNSDHDVALTKYRVAMAQTPHSAELWNNVGLCFLAKGKYVGAAASLKRAAYLSPFDERICHNLGLCHLHLEQPASAFHYFSAGINLYAQKNEKNPLGGAAGAAAARSSSSSSSSAEGKCYAFMAVALGKLGDFDNSFAAYARAIELCPSDHVAHLNYCVARCKAWQGQLESGAGSDTEVVTRAKEAAARQLSAYEQCMRERSGKKEETMDLSDAQEEETLYLTMKQLLRT